MLRRLKITNIALIENETIEFEPGFTVFSGETGAGKSLVVDSLNLVLGARADKSLITFGKDYAEVEAFFDCLSSSSVDILRSFGIDDEEIIVVRRVFQDGRNDVKVNGHSLTVKMLKLLSSSLVDVCGQFENQTMFSAQNQLSLIDSVANNGELLKKLGNLFDSEKEVDSKLEELGGNQTERERMLDMLSYQISELEEADFKDGEEEQLLQSHRRIVAKEKIIDSLSNALKSLDEEFENNVADKLKESALVLSGVSQNDEKIADVESRLLTLSYDAKDCICELEGIREEFLSDEIDIDSIEQRLDLLNKFKKKYGESIVEFNEFLRNAKEKYDLIVDSSANIEKLMKEKAQLRAEQNGVAEEISVRRAKVADLFSKDIEKELAQLGMKSAKFAVFIGKKQQVDRTGIDIVEFRFSANSGMPVSSLSKVASGGELSRFMLALKTVIGRHSDIATMVFDEIDSGISGLIGRIVGEKLYMVSKGCQVICVSHLAQIAAIADNNYLIEKIENNDLTRTRVLLLDENSKIKEIARLAGGEFETKISLEHAKDLIEKATSFKNSLNK